MKIAQILLLLTVLFGVASAQERTGRPFIFSEFMNLEEFRDYTHKNCGSSIVELIDHLREEKGVEIGCTCELNTQIEIFLPQCFVLEAKGETEV